MRLKVQIPRSIALTMLAAICVYNEPLASARQSESMAQDVPGDTLITLERTPCYGFCPSYTITISAEGAVLYEGRRSVKTVGTAKSTISLEKLRALVNWFAEINYFDLKNWYEKHGDCESWVTDHPSAITSIRIKGKSKTVRHYHGCRGGKALDDLTKLEQAIDDAVNSAQWIR